MAKSKIFKVKRHVVDGELSGKAKNSYDIVDELDSLMDSACSWDIVGPALIEDTDGNFYKVNIDAYLRKISKKEAREMAINNEIDLETGKSIK